MNSNLESSISLLSILSTLISALLQEVLVPLFLGSQSTFEIKFSLYSNIFPSTSFSFTLKKIFLSVPCSMWDLSSLTRDQTHAPLQRKHRVLTTRPPGSPIFWYTFWKGYMGGKFCFCFCFFFYFFNFILFLNFT